MGSWQNQFRVVWGKDGVIKSSKIFAWPEGNVRLSRRLFPKGVLVVTVTTIFTIQAVAVHLFVDPGESPYGYRGVKKNAIRYSVPIAFEVDCWGCVLDRRRVSNLFWE
jgi:hypothetical protein